MCARANQWIFPILRLLFREVDRAIIYIHRNHHPRSSLPITQPCMVICCPLELLRHLACTLSINSLLLTKGHNRYIYIHIIYTLYYIFIYNDYRQDRINRGVTGIYIYVYFSLVSRFRGLYILQNRSYVSSNLYHHPPYDLVVSPYAWFPGIQRCCMFSSSSYMVS